MAKTNPEVILLLGYPINKEGKASEEIFPGHLVEFGGIHTLQKQSTAGQNCRRAFAIENDLVGKGIEDSYAISEQLQYISTGPGTEIYARVAAGAPAILTGDQLEAAGDGTLQKLTTGDVIGYAIEDKDNSVGTEEVFLKMEVA